MAVDLDKPISNINVTDPDYQRLLQDLQGNILKSHGREHAVYMLVRFKHDTAEDRQNARDWIQCFADHVTSAHMQLDESRKRKEALKKEQLFAGKLFTSLLLSATAYTNLGCARRPLDWCFRLGQASAGEKLGDHPATAWEPGFQNVDALILLADDHVDRLYGRYKEISKDIHEKGIGQVLRTDVGHVLRNTKRQAVEHFGYVDGVSQPLFFQDDIIQATQQNVGKNQWDPGAPLSLVLARDLHGCGPYSFGSYGVYRKLAQHVDCFKDYLKQVAQEQNISEEHVGARLIGRFQNGRPLALQDRAENGDPIANNFNYTEDQGGARCPFSAHIRKANPRNDVETLKVRVEWARERRIARRSIPYGIPYDPDMRSEDKYVRGLLFLCFQSNIAEQFEYIQHAWASDQHFVHREAGPDTIIGRNAPFVTMRGGEYFFAPSRSGLKNLSERQN